MRKMGTHPLQCWLLTLCLLATTAADTLGRETAWRSPIIDIEQAEVVKAADDIRKLFPAQAQAKTPSVYIRVTTREPVFLYGASTPTIHLNGEAVATRFEPYQASTFYARVDDTGLLKAFNQVTLEWPGAQQYKAANAGAYQMPFKLE